MLRLLIAACTLFVTISAGAKEYRFKDYPPQPHANRVLEKVDLNSHPDSHYFKDRLEMLVGSEPDFAGKYIVAAFGCGTACQAVTLIDVDTGEIAMPTNASDGLCYSKDSSLLIINPYIADSYDGDLPEWAYTYYYALRNGHLELLHQSKEPFKGDCKSGQS